jgi:DNA-nicking Smr family endonuclease
VPRPEPVEPPFEIDLHGLRPDQALRRLGQELHACRLRQRTEVLVITGRGWGNLQQKPGLRPKFAAWLRGADGQRLGVNDFIEHSQGGALLVRLRAPGARPSSP